jgi:hypothetical protein
MSVTRFVGDGRASERNYVDRELEESSLLCFCLYLLGFGRANSIDGFSLGGLV